MATFVGQQENIIDAIKSLIELDFDAIEAYDAAINRLENELYKKAMKEFKSDHERHIRELRQYLEANNEEAPLEADIKSILTQGKVAIAALVGDKTVLRAMKSNEEDTNAAYECMIKHRGVSGQLADILKRGLEDERKHYRWIDNTLNDVKISA
jgi:rubrerythrin